MSYIRPDQLESCQVYGGSPFKNPHDHPDERDGWETVCADCEETPVDEEGDLCWACQDKRDVEESYKEEAGDERHN